jgi:hypothetical protein
MVQKNLQIKALLSSRFIRRVTFKQLLFKQDLSLSTQSGLRDISLDDISRDDISRDDVSNVTPLNGSSRTLKSLQSTFERHFRETLLCDSNNIIFK